jgi:hypothetical protein
MWISGHTTLRDMLLAMYYVGHNILLTDIAVFEKSVTLCPRNYDKYPLYLRNNVIVSENRYKHTSIKFIALKKCVGGHKEFLRPRHRTQGQTYLSVKKIWYKHCCNAQSNNSGHVRSLLFNYLENWETSGGLLDIKCILISPEHVLETRFAMILISRVTVKVYAETHLIMCNVRYCWHILTNRNWN